MGRSSEAAMQQDEQENLSGMDLCEAYHAEQAALPKHKRDGYSERMYELADEARKAARENFTEI